MKRLILPIVQEYEDAGEFTFKEKLKRSLFNNLIFYGIIIIFGLIFIGIVMIFSGSILK